MSNKFRGFWRLFFSFFLIFGLITGVIVAQNRTSFLPRAKEKSPTYNTRSSHEIAIRQGINGPEFYSTISSKQFIPRGNNYIRLAEINDPWNGKTIYHSLFDPGFYSSNKVGSALLQMQKSGYNVVRVFISDSAIGDKNGGLSLSYLKNVVDFLNQAKNNKIFVSLTFPFLPKQGGYYFKNQNPNQIEGYNWFYLSPEALEAKKKYLKDFVLKLNDLNAPLDHIFSYNIENEIYFNKDQKPLSLKTGYVKTANGQSYDLSQPAQMQQMMDANLVYWINEVRSAIKQVDPTALIAPGFFSPKMVEGIYPMTIRTYWAIANTNIGGSSADFIDLHIYPGFSTLAQDIAAFEISKTNKPLVLGEFGAYKSKFSNISNAAYSLRDLEKETCTKYGFKGWFAWTWDTTEQPELYNIAENNGAINGVLAPIVRPDPCK